MIGTFVNQSTQPSPHQFSIVDLIGIGGKFDSYTMMSDTYCPDCKKNTEVVCDHAAGDTVCSECGLVLEARSIDETSEWRTFADDSGDHDPNRVGGPVNPLLGDAALSTVISRATNGANVDMSLTRLQNRGGDPDRALVLAFKTISSMADRSVIGVLLLV